MVARRLRSSRDPPSWLFLRARASALPSQSTTVGADDRLLPPTIFDMNAATLDRRLPSGFCLEGLGMD